MKRAMVIVVLALVGAGLARTTAQESDVRVTNDCVTPPTPDPGPGYVVPPGCPPGSPAGYVSSYTIATGQPYSDLILTECSIAHGRQNEPAVEVDPRDPSVLIASSNDYCGVYAGRGAGGEPVPTGPIWLGYYRSEDAGRSFLNSLVPGYPGDTSPFAALAEIRTAGAGDPVIAWDAEGRVFLGSESSDDPAGSAKTFGDVWVARYDNPGGPSGPTANDGKRYDGTTVVARGSAAPNLLGVFHDKTTIAADHNADGRCDNFVYFGWSRFNGNGANALYFSRSSDHGATFSNPNRLSQPVQDLQFGDIAVTGNSNVYVTFRGFGRVNGQSDGVYIVRSADCGATFGPARLLTTFVPYDALDVQAPEPAPTSSGIDEPFEDGESRTAAAGALARDCGDFDAHCLSGYTFFRRDTQVRSTGNQFDVLNPDRVYIVYDPSRPGTETPTGTSYGSIARGIGSQSAIYFAAVNGATLAWDVEPRLIDTEATGHQLFPDISADTPAGAPTMLHTIWWDSRLDPCYSPTRPIGNCADRRTVPSIDAWGATSTNGGTTWLAGRVSGISSNPNFEQFSNRTVPFAGDYLWVTSLGSYGYGVWTDWRDTRQGQDPREITEDEDDATADVYQCRELETVAGKKGITSQAWSGDLCPRSGGLDQNIYGNAVSSPPLVASAHAKGAPTKRVTNAALSDAPQRRSTVVR